MSTPTKPILNKRPRKFGPARIGVYAFLMMA